MSSDLGKQIWAGDYWGSEGAVARARTAYIKDPEENLFLWATAIYSGYGRAQKEFYFRQSKERKDTLRKDFAMIVSMIVDRFRRESGTLSADQMELIAAHLEWWSRMPHTKVESAQEFRDIAKNACARGLLLTENSPKGAHTRALLALTHAFLYPWTEGEHDWRWAAAIAKADAPFIENPDQKARVYRKLAHIRFVHWQLVRGVGALWSMARVKGISPDTRFKNRPI